MTGSEATLTRQSVVINGEWSASVTAVVQDALAVGQPCVVEVETQARKEAAERALRRLAPRRTDITFVVVPTCS